MGRVGLQILRIVVSGIMKQQSIVYCGDVKSGPTSIMQKAMLKVG